MSALTLSLVWFCHLSKHPYSPTQLSPILPHYNLFNAFFFLCLKSRTPLYSSQSSPSSSRLNSLIFPVNRQPSGAEMKSAFSLLSSLLLIFIHFTATSGQAPAQAPAPPGPTNITAVLEKAGQFTTFMRLLKSTQVGDQLKTQLNNSNQGLTIFAPTDNAFSSLKAGTLNSLSDQQKVQLLQFHIVPSFFSTSQFQTASNPLRTQAGGSDGEFPLNVTTSGTQVNITTGVVNATVANTIYTDGQIAVYQVDQVLLPQSFFASPSPSPAPAPLKRKKGSSDSSSDADDDNVPTESSGANPFTWNILSATSPILLAMLNFAL